MTLAGSISKLKLAIVHTVNAVEKLQTSRALGSVHASEKRKSS